MPYSTSKTGSLFAILFVVGSITLYAQNTKIFISTGLGSYDMGDLKNLELNILSQIPVRLNSLDHFPAHQNFEIGMSFPILLDKYRTGFVFSTQSTGSRAGLKDYSGHYKVDQHVNSFAIGTFFDLPLQKFNWMNLYIRCKLNYQSTTLKLSEDVQIGDFKSNNDLSFKSDGLEIGPELYVEKNIKWFSIFTNLGYSFNLAGALHLQDDNDSYLQLNEDEVSANWTGWRVRIGTAINF